MHFMAGQRQDLAQQYPDMRIVVDDHDGGDHDAALSVARIASNDAWQGRQRGMGGSPGGRY